MSAEADVPDRCEDPIGMAGTAISWTPVEGGESVPAIVREQVTIEAGGAVQTRVVIEPEDRDGLVETINDRLEVIR